MRAFVYFAKFDNQTIKIGISQNLTNRLRQLEGETGRRGSFLGRLDVTQREAPIIERALHRALGSFWLHGEWFTDCPEVRAEIHRLMRDPMAVQAIVDRVRSAARSHVQRSTGARPNVRVIARLAGDIMRARGPECPDMVLDEDLEKACEGYRIPTDESARARAIRIARSRIQQQRRGAPASAADAGESHTPVQRVTKVLETLIQRHTYSTAADLSEDLKRQCARLHIPYDAALIHAAVDLGERGGRRPLITQSTSAPSPEPAVLEPPVSHNEAVQILAGLGVGRVPAMTAVRPLSHDEIGQRQYRADQLKAYRLVQQQILETAQRVAALEDAIEVADQETPTS